MQERVSKLGEEKPRYGYRRITALLRREGLRINEKRVQRLRRLEGAQVRRKQKRMRRVGPQQSERLRATQPRQVWSWDFVEDQTENGTRFRILTLLDEHTRQCLAIFGTLAEARVILESWRVEYNEKRPHSSLGYQTPEEFAASVEKVPQNGKSWFPERIDLAVAPGAACAGINGGSAVQLLASLFQHTQQLICKDQLQQK